jgi:serine/threonine-protein kinase
VVLGRLGVVEERLTPGLLVAKRYRLDRIVGEGGMGVVWAATEVETGDARALKFLKSDNAHAHARFLREARASQAVKHPAVAPVLEVGELSDGRPFLVMELFRGETLAARLARKPLTLGEMARVMRRVVEAVQAAHAQGIVHRDLKPDNVFLIDSSLDDVRVLDFGIAKEIRPDHDGESTSLTATGSMIGTPHYMAPEQIFGDSDIDARADVWALGVIVYECAAGRRPTQASGVGQVLKIIATDSIPPLSKVAPNTPHALSDLLERMLTRDRAKRPSLDEVLEVLASLDGAHAISLGTPTPQEATLDTHAPAPTTRRKRRLNPALYALGGLIAGGGALWLFHSRASTAMSQQEPSPSSTLRPIDDVVVTAPVAVSASDATVAASSPAVAPTSPPRKRNLAARDAGVDAMSAPAGSTSQYTSVNIPSHDRN